MSRADLNRHREETALAVVPSLGLGGVWNAVRSWRAGAARRRALRHLLKLEDWQLSDLGLSRSRLCQEATSLFSAQPQSCR